MPRKSLVALLATTAVASLTAADARAADRITITGLTESETALVTFPSDKPQRTTAPVAIAGLGAGERVVGIDRRPRNGELFAVTTANRLLVVDAETGASTVRATLSVPLSGRRFGVDFNPTVDRLRIVSDAEQNLRVVPDTGATTVDTPLNYAAGDPNAGADPTIAGAAYTNNDNDNLAPVAGTPTPTELFDIDATLGVLALQNLPNAGTLLTRGPLGQTDYQQVGLDNYSDIEGGSAVTNDTYASLGKGGAEKLYRVDRSTGAATLIGPFGQQGIADIAVPIDRG